MLGRFKSKPHILNDTTNTTCIYDHDIQIYCEYSLAIYTSIIFFIFFFFFLLRIARNWKMSRQRRKGWGWGVGALTKMHAVSPDATRRFALCASLWNHMRSSARWNTVIPRSGHHGFPETSLTETDTWDAFSSAATTGLWWSTWRSVCLSVRPDMVGCRRIAFPYTFNIDVQQISVQYLLVTRNFTPFPVAAGLLLHVGLVYLHVIFLQMMLAHRAFPPYYPDE